MRQRYFRLPRLCWNLIRVFNRADAAMSYIDLLAALDRSRPPGSQPFFDFGQVPDHTARRECKAARELSTLLHAEDRTVSERHDLLQLLSADGAGKFPSLLLVHIKYRSFLKRFRLKANVTKGWKDFS